MLRVLGIESSCDETAIAIVDEARTIHAERIRSQWEEHRPYGGVVPEIAARAHIECVDRLVAETMEEAALSFSDLDAIAATGGPGLIGGVIVGVMTAKAIASVHKKPLIMINHLEGHALTARLTDDVSFPYLLLLVSGGHCQILIVEGVGSYRLLGKTRDDALGEAFDKTAKMLGLPYPGGPSVERLAGSGDSSRFPLPRPLAGKPGCDFSFSGLKNAVRMEIEALGTLNEQDKADMCAAFQAAAADVLEERITHAIALSMQSCPGLSTLVVAGGVAANQMLKMRLQAVTIRHGWKLVVPSPALCTDNGAMIAWAGLERFRLGHRDNFDFEPRARWPLAAG